MATEQSSLDCQQLEEEEDSMNDGSTGCAECFKSDEDQSIQMKSGHEKKPSGKKWQRSITVNSDIVKFISKRKLYSEQLRKQLQKFHADVLLMPEESVIQVTKKQGSIFIKDWNNKCCSTVKTFCDRFKKESFELGESKSVQKQLPKLGRMLRSTSAAYWIEASHKLAVMTERNEREQVLNKVRVFLKNNNDDGFQEYKKRGRSDQSNWRKPSEYKESRNIDVAQETNYFNLLSDEARCMSAEDAEQLEEEENDSKQIPNNVKLDNDITKFLMKRKKYFDELNAQFSQFGAEVQLRPGLIKIKRIDSSTDENWEKNCQDIVIEFCSSFKKQSFALDESIQESILKALLSIQLSVSSTGAACWLDSQKRNLILVSPMAEFSNMVKEVEEFIKKVGIFATKSFKIEESIRALVEKDLASLNDELKSCKVTLEKENLLVICLRSEMNNVVDIVECFFHKLQRIKQADVTNRVQRPRVRRLPSGPARSKTDETLTWRNNNSSGSITSLSEDTQSRTRSWPLEPVSLKINNDVVKFVMNNPAFCQELTEQIGKLNGEFQWKVGIPFVTVLQKSEKVFVHNWSEVCKSSVTKFFQRFRKESYIIQEDLQDTIRQGLEEIKETLRLSRADCWLASNNRWLVLVVLKDNLSDVVKIVEQFLQNAKDENERVKEIINFLPVSADHIDYLELTQFLGELKQSHPGLVEATFTEKRDQIRFVGSDEDISAAKKQYEDLIKELNVTEFELCTEAMKFVSRGNGMDFIEKCLSEREIVSVILVESKSRVKIVARSPQECDAVKECLRKNVCKATINLPSPNEHVFASKKWDDISKAIDSEELLEYQINCDDGTKRDIKLHGATPQVEKYDKIVTDFINSQKIESNVVHISPGIARFMKEKLGKEIEKIETDLIEEQLKIEIGFGNIKYTSTKEGIKESKRRIMELKDDIYKECKTYSSVGVGKLFFSEDGQRNIKGIEAGSNVKIEVENGPSEKDSNHIDVEVLRTEREERMEEIKQCPTTPGDPFDHCKFTTREGLDVSWKYGNIAQERADILVSSAVSNLNHPTMVGKVLNSIGGSSYIADCSQHTHIGTGDIATTIGGNLACDHVIHAVCCKWMGAGRAEQTLRNLLHKILSECNRLSARSVAMPLIGTGKHNFPEDVVLRVMREEFENFSSMCPRGTLKEIMLVRYDPGSRRQPRTQALSSMRRRSLGTRLRRRKAVQTQVTRDLFQSQSRPTFVGLVAGKSVESVELQVYARSKDDIFSALNEIEKFVTNHITSKKVENEKLYDVVLKHWSDLEPLAKDNFLKITCVNETSVTVEGLLSKVLEVKDKITEWINQYDEEERRSQQLSYISKNIQWYYYDHTSREVAYSAQVNGTIEVAHMNGMATVEIVESDGQQYEVNFTEMVAKSKSTGQTKKLFKRRIDSSTELSLPPNWKPQSADQVVELVRIMPSSSEYSEVCSHFVARGGRSDQLYMIERIQNPQLYSMYLAFKKTMRGAINEMRLFHGTVAANVDSINTHNFSRSFAGVNGTSYGHGVYFALNASYSIRYAKPEPFGRRRKMYMAKVLVGEYTKGGSGMKAPPSKNDPNNPGLCYDSVVNNIHDPTMYIIFHDNQYYPMYLLTLQ